MGGPPRRLKPPMERPMPGPGMLLSTRGPGMVLYSRHPGVVAMIYVICLYAGAGKIAGFHFYLNHICCCRVLYCRKAMLYR